MNKLLSNRNKGISLIEIIVVVAIMSIIAGGVTFSLKMVANKAADKCAKKMQVSIERNRTATMSKKNGKINFYIGTDGAIYMTEEFDSGATVTTPTMVGEKTVTITYGTANTKLVDGTTISFVFNRSDGSLYSGSDYLPITISKGTKTYTLRIDSLTGRVTVEK